MPKEDDYKICSVSVMDNISDPDIIFDSNGICNYYYDYHEKAKYRLFDKEIAQARLDVIIQKIKQAGAGKEYDCVIGISGGVDSTYVAYLVKKLGLRPLAVHFDNGWNSELAVKNIERVLNKLDIDLFTYVIDWEEFKSLQIAFLKSATPDGEIPTDHAISALLLNVANEHNVKFVINGGNFTTESILPASWAYGHMDWKYIKKINEQFGTRKLKNYPHLSISKYVYYTFFKGIKNVSILNYIEYNKGEAMRILQVELGWKYYGGKHYESIYTRFYQGYILPHKFRIDKRKAHLSTLIFSKQLTREKALEELLKPVYPEGLLSEDRIFVLKKLEFNEQAFEEILNLPIKSFKDYPSQYKVLQFLKKILNKLRGKGILPS